MNLLTGASLLALAKSIYYLPAVMTEQGLLSRKRQGAAGQGFVEI